MALNVHELTGSKSKNYSMNGIKSKTCSHPNCCWPVFSGGYCKKHQYLNPKAKKPVFKKSPVKKVSLKQRELNAVYKFIRKEIEEDLKAIGQWRCFMTNEPFPDNYMPDFHHLAGREGNVGGIPLTIYKPFIKPVFNKPHDLYHHGVTSDIINQSWWPGFLQRLKMLSEDLYEKEIYRINKQQYGSIKSKNRSNEISNPGKGPANTDGGI